MLRIALLLGAIVFLPLQAVAASSMPRLTGNVAEQYLLAAANQERAARGLPKLRNDPVLAKAARFHAMQMAAHNGISHQFPGEPELSERGARAGAHFSLITENVAQAPDSSMFHQMWMNSKGHRANLLDPHVNVVGIAVVTHAGQFYAVEDFASTVVTINFNQQEATVARLLSQRGLNVGPTSRTASLADARRTCGMDTGFAGQHKPWFIMRYTASRLDQLPDQLASRINSGRYHQAVVAACADNNTGPFTAYNIAVLLYP
ncbi:CAP domain-containing protein [Edaphobacter aggregans]|uniref:CAP domain-containing protein n=1 Tax=Edaphobacter aggregans TaxID=570835 RepID=UPI0014704411|nr:CAP domain-containing protein [Edaphobacter aggregans]